MVKDKLIIKRYKEDQTTWYFDFKDKYGNIKYSLTEDYKILANAIINIMSMYKDGEVIYFETSEGVETCSKDAHTLSENLMKHLFQFAPVDRRVWMKVALNITPFLPSKKQNDKYIAFKNLAIEFNDPKNIEELKAVEKIDNCDNRFDYNYIRNEEDLHPESLALFNQIMDNYTADIKDEKAKEEWKRELLKITGYLLTPNNWLEKVFIFRSKPGTGKSLWLNILQEIYKNNAAPYSPQAADQFAESGIYKKRFIYAGELEGGKWTRQKEIQQLASGETFPLRMNGGRMVTWKNPRVQIIFLTNKKLTADKEDGIWDRFHIFEFITKIRGTKMSGENSLKGKTTSKKFIETFIHFAMKGLEDVLKTGLKQNLGLIKKELSSQDNVLSFLQDIQHGEIKVDRIIKPVVLFKKYNSWKYDAGIKNDNLTKKEFTENLKDYILSSGFPRPRSLNNTTVRAWDLSYITHDVKEKLVAKEDYELKEEELAMEEQAKIAEKQEEQKQYMQEEEDFLEGLD